MAQIPIRILGVDPGLSATGWGVIEATGARLSFRACGSIVCGPDLALSRRLALIHGQARGVALAALALAGLQVAEYAANLVKKTVVGVGHAEKQQVAMMVKMLLPACRIGSPDAADALAVAICHAQHRTARARGAA